MSQTEEETSLPESKDPAFEHQVQRLHELVVWGRWLVIGLLWLTIAPLSLWGLREEMQLWLDYFTWAALYHGLGAHLLSTIGLAICIGMTLGTLLWQSRNILWGLPQYDRQQLVRHVCRIRQQGPSHPLWKWVCGHSQNHNRS
jgi:hypothetical protein